MKTLKLTCKGCIGRDKIIHSLSGEIDRLDAKKSHSKSQITKPLAPTRDERRRENLKALELDRRNDDVLELPPVSISSGDFERINIGGGIVSIRW